MGVKKVYTRAEKKSFKKGLMIGIAKKPTRRPLKKKR